MWSGWLWCQVWNLGCCWKGPCLAQGISWSEELQGKEWWWCGPWDHWHCARAAKPPCVSRSFYCYWGPDGSRKLNLQLWDNPGQDTGKLSCSIWESGSLQRCKQMSCDSPGRIMQPWSQTGFCLDDLQLDPICVLSSRAGEILGKTIHLLFWGKQFTFTLKLYPFREGNPGMNYLLIYWGEQADWLLRFCGVNWFGMHTSKTLVWLKENREIFSHTFNWRKAFSSCIHK